MAQILDALNVYVPTKQMINSEAQIPRIVFGDQLTAARIRGAAILRSSHLTMKTKLGGFVEAVSDWHARLCLVTICKTCICTYIHLHTSIITVVDHC